MHGVGSFVARPGACLADHPLDGRLPRTALRCVLALPRPPALVGTPYGRALLVKLGLLVLVSAVGGANLILRGRRPFDRLIVVELVLALGIFAATGFLTSLPPPAP